MKKRLIIILFILFISILFLFFTANIFTGNQIRNFTGGLQTAEPSLGSSGVSDTQNDLQVAPGIEPTGNETDNKTIPIVIAPSEPSNASVNDTDKTDVQAREEIFELPKKIESSSPEIIKKSEEVQKLNSDLAELKMEYSKTSFFKFSEKKEILIGSEEKAIERKTKLFELIEENPSAFLQQVIPKNERDAFPKKIKEHIEEEVEIEGRLEWVHFESLDWRESEDRYFLRQKKGETIELHFIWNEMQAYEDEKIIEMSGWKLDNQFLVLPGYEFKQLENKELENRLEPEFNIVEKDYEVAVIFINFMNNDTSEPFTKDKIHDLIIANPRSVKNYYKESSYGKMNIVSDIDKDFYGYYTVKPTCDVMGLVDRAKAAAKKDGFLDKENDTQQTVFVMFPDIGCYAGTAFASDGIVWYSSRNKENLDKDPKSLFRGFSHEFGHAAFNFHHAGILDCVDEIGSRVSIGENCAELSWGNAIQDTTDVMGLEHRILNIANKEGANFLRVPEITQSGYYTIFANGGNKFPQGLKILLQKGDWEENTFNYYLEYRQPRGIFDDFAVNDATTRGLSITVSARGFWIPTSRLDAELDDGWIYDSGIGAIETLYPGRTFKNPFGLIIKTISVDSEKALVYIDMDNYSPCGMEDLEIIYDSPGDMKIGEPSIYNFRFTNTGSEGCYPREFSILDAVVDGSWLKMNPNYDSYLIAPDKIRIGSGASDTLSAVIIPKITPENCIQGKQHYLFFVFAEKRRMFLYSDVNWQPFSATPPPPFANYEILPSHKCDQIIHN